MKTRTVELVSNIQHEFNRLMVFNKSTGIKLEITNNEDNLLIITFTNAKITQSVTVPLPVITKEGIELLYCGDVVRVLCNFWLETEQKMLNYHDIMKYVFCRDIAEIMPEKSCTTSMIHKIIRGFKENKVSYMIHQLQRLINQFVCLMPLHETNMNSWVMNKRLIIIDPNFYNQELQDPNKRLDYQINKNNKYYSKFGWTSIGLSDGTLADKNNILTIDLRETIPFGHHHNPQRNLYSTLCMKGDELPRVRSESMQALIERGITRTGWNLFTAIIDTDMVFEDQILVSKRHKNKGHVVKRRYTIFGTKLQVKINDHVNTGDILGFSNDGEPTILNIRCDSAKVVDITKSKINVGGEIADVSIIKIEGFRSFKDGTKFSNMAGNKGIVRLTDLGYAIDPKTGNKVQIDVVISAKSINKRKNFSQILEAVINNVCPGDKPIVIDNDHETTKEKMMAALKNSGYPSDGTWAINTPWGEYQAICGKMFWGVTKDPEDAVWDEEKTNITDNRELRKSGLKFSHVELKALITRFGPKNAVLKEIMSYAQGTNILIDEIKILKSLKNELPPNCPIVMFHDLSYVNNSGGMFHTEAEISGSVVDEFIFPNGFILALPIDIQALVSNKDKEEYVIGVPQKTIPDDMCEYTFNKIYIPNAFLRRCWKHPSGKWGFSTIGAHVNHIVERCQQFDAHPTIENHMAIIHAVIHYINETCRMMGTKNGDMSVYGMSVRYPHSVRATASLSNDLPSNTVEIHRSMAQKLGVKTGDVVIAERFPCLGFMSIRPQYVRVTDDIECLYTIRVSGNCLVSMDLDFDGDTLFLASFKTPQAIELLHSEMKNPNKICENEILNLNNNKKPVFKEMSLDTYDIMVFPKPTVEEHAIIVKRATGVKSHTGPVIALSYNLMRIVERNVPFTDVGQHAALEIMLHFLGNTVFKQKHGIESLQEAATDAICVANVDKLVELGFSRVSSKLLCDIIIKEAGKLGITDLVHYHQQVKEKGWSKIINKIVREFNKVYFASRASMTPFNLIEHLECAAVDLPSMMFHIALKMPEKNVEEELKHKRLNKELREARFKTAESIKAYSVLSEYIDKIMTKEIAYEYE